MSGQVAPLINKHGLANMAADRAAAAAGSRLLGMSPRLRWPNRSANPEIVEGIGDAARGALPEWLVA